MDELDLSQEELEALMQLGVFPEQIEDIGRQEDIYNQLRYGAGPDMRQAGRTVVAANPLEFVGDLMQKYQAGKKLKGLEAQREDIYGAQKRGRGMYLDILRGRGQMSPVGDVGSNELAIHQGMQNTRPIPEVSYQPTSPAPSMPSPSAAPTPPSPPASPAPAGGFGRGGRRRTPDELKKMAMLLRGFG